LRLARYWLGRMLAESAIGDRLEEERGLTIRLRRRVIQWFVG